MSISQQQIKIYCHEAGFSNYAILPVPSELPASGLHRMLSEGVGDMEYLLHNMEVRLAPAKLFPGLSHIIVIAESYQQELSVHTSEKNIIKRARYAAGKDYHKLLRRKLQFLGERILANSEKPVEFRAFVDSAPINERTLASMAGLGWIGKNSLLIIPGKGSYHFLGFLFLKAEIETTTIDLTKDRCGKCNKCETACPTAALIDRYVISLRCISYLTIEHKGIIPRAIAEKFSGWWFGCDICQEVCPWNKFVAKVIDNRFTGSEKADDLISITQKDYDKYFEGRVIRRIDYSRFRRNLLVAYYSVGRKDLCKIIANDELPLVHAQAEELNLS